MEDNQPKLIRKERMPCGDGAIYKPIREKGKRNKNKNNNDNNDIDVDDTIIINNKSNSYNKVETIKLSQASINVLNSVFNNNIYEQDEAVGGVIISNERSLYKKQ